MGDPSKGAFKGLFIAPLLFELLYSFKKGGSRTIVSRPSNGGLANASERRYRSLYTMLSKDCSSSGEVNLRALEELGKSTSPSQVTWSCERP